MRPAMVSPILRIESSVIAARSKRGALVQKASLFLWHPLVGSFIMTGRLTLVISYPIHFLMILQTGTGSSGFKLGSWSLEFWFTKIRLPRNSSCTFYSLFLSGVPSSFDSYHSLFSSFSAIGERRDPCVSLTYSYDFGSGILEKGCILTAVKSFDWADFISLQLWLYPSSLSLEPW